MNLNKYFLKARFHVQQKQIPIITCLLLLGLGVSTWLRVIIGGKGAGSSPTAGLIFAVCLVAFTCIAGTSVRLQSRMIIMGLLAGALLCIPTVLIEIIGGHRIEPVIHGYIWWGVVVTVVAFAEEAFLRGALFDLVQKWLGGTLAILVSAAAFAALHVPFYGWHVLPLDFSVGIWLGILRLLTGTFIAPGIAHVFADLASWWLR